MLNDAVNYVRQGVLIASALICIQHTEATCPKVCYHFKNKFVSNLSI
jgi:26S proteasome regulatory subunit N2